MPKPFRGTITGRSSTGDLIRAGKDVWLRGLYRRLGPEEFYRRRLIWLALNGKRTSYDRLAAYLRREFGQSAELARFPATFDELVERLRTRGFSKQP